MVADGKASALTPHIVTCVGSQPNATIFFSKPMERKTLIHKTDVGIHSNLFRNLKTKSAKAVIEGYAGNELSGSFGMADVRPFT